jgi:hypothetical protein
MNKDLLNSLTDSALPALPDSQEPREPSEPEPTEGRDFERGRRQVLPMRHRSTDSQRLLNALALSKAGE